MTYNILTDSGCCHFEIHLNYTYDEIVEERGFWFVKTRIKYINLRAYIILTDPCFCNFEFYLKRTHEEVVKDRGFVLDKTKIY